MHYLVLPPPEPVCVERVQNLAGHGFTDPAATRQMHAEFAGSGIHLGLSTGAPDRALLAWLLVLVTQPVQEQRRTACPSGVPHRTPCSVRMPTLSIVIQGQHRTAVRVWLRQPALTTARDGHREGADERIAESVPLGC